MSSALSPSPSPPLRTYLITLVVAGAGGVGFALLHIPLAWMLGAMAATGALAWHGRAAVWKPARPAALILLGLGLGQTFTPSVMAAIGYAVPWIMLAAVISVAVGACSSQVFAHLAGTDPRTGYYASVPGGVILMVVLAQRAGVSVPAVTLAQTIRVLVVVVLVPPLVTWLAPRGGASAFLAERPEVHLWGLAMMVPAGTVVALAVARTGLANPWMIGPCVMVMVLSFFGQLPSGVPIWMVDIAQIGMGMSLGQRLNKNFLLASRRLAIASAASTVVLCTLMAAMAVLMALVSGLPVGAVVLGMAPGGMPEMTITAKSLEVGVPLVLGFHLIRTFLCNFLIEPGWRVALRLGIAK